MKTTYAPTLDQGFNFGAWGHSAERGQEKELFHELQRIGISNNGGLCLVFCGAGKRNREEGVWSCFKTQRIPGFGESPLAEPGF